MAIDPNTPSVQSQLSAQLTAQASRQVSAQSGVQADVTRLKAHKNAQLAKPTSDGLNADRDRRKNVPVGEKRASHRSLALSSNSQLEAAKDAVKNLAGRGIIRESPLGRTSLATANGLRSGTIGLGQIVDIRV